MNSRLLVGSRVYCVVTPPVSDWPKPFVYAAPLTSRRAHRQAVQRPVGIDAGRRQGHGEVAIDRRAIVGVDAEIQSGVGGRGPAPGLLPGAGRARPFTRADQAPGTGTRGSESRRS